MATVTLRYDPAWKAMEWALVNCSSYITNSVNEASRQTAEDPLDCYIDYYFSDENQALIFLLKWT